MLTRNTLDHHPAQAQFFAELDGSDTCNACGIAGHGNAPVLDLCRRLVAAGFDPATPLKVYRGEILCLTVRSIGEGARLEINGEGSGFRPLRQPDAASPMRFGGSQ
jgi:hypothetical protein